jgi:hypothetical protein
MAMTRLALLQRLKQLQQMAKFQERDITTVSALLSNEALAKHVEVCEMAVGARTRHDGRSDGEESGRTLRQA